MSPIKQSIPQTTYLDYYQQIVDNSADAIYLIEVTPEGRFIHLDINPAFVAASGMSKEAIIGCYVDEFENEAFRAILTEKYTACYTARTKTNYINDYPLHFGIRTIHSVLTPLFDETGRLYRIAGIARDITEHKRMESELAAREQDFRSLADNTPDNIVRWDCEGRYLYINPAHERTLEKTADEVIGTQIPDTHEAVKTTVANVIATGKQITVSQTVTTINGEHEYHEVSIVPERDASGAIIGVLGIGRDITARKRAEDNLKRTKAKLAAVISTIPDLIWVKNHDGVYMMCNPAFENFFGASSDEIIGKTDYDFISKEQADFFRQKDKEAMAAGKMCINEEEIVFAHNGQHALLETRKIPVYNEGIFMGVLGIGRDITEKKQIEKRMLQNESRLKEAQKIAKVGSWELNFSDSTLSWSDEIFRIFELDPNRFQPSYAHFLNAIHPEDRMMVNAEFQRSLSDKTPYNLTHRLLMPDGRVKYVQEIGETTFDEQGNPFRTIGTVQDITERKVVEQKIEYMAHHDMLTGLSNRAFAREQAHPILHNAKRLGGMVAFAFIDLDGFKIVNDTLGHAIGDLLLESISQKLQNNLRAEDILSRQGGDEFLLILPNLSSPDEATQIINRLQSDLDQTISILDYELSLSMSIGIAIYPIHGDTFDDLLKKADTAMYKAKESGKNTYSVYTDATNEYTVEKLTIQSEIKKAITQGDFQLYYQPQIDIKSGQLIGAEALIRWMHPDKGMISPNDFITAAEISGLIVPLGEWVIRQACQQIADWRKKGIDISVAVNVSPIQLKRGNIEQVVKEAVTNTHIQPEWLELELTESSMMTDAENSLQTLQNLKDFGVKLAIDDFGTGYSSLAYLKRFAVNKLKIDKSFITDLNANPDDIVIVRAIVQMAKNLNLLTIAEGVEDEDVIELMSVIGCNEVQGYYYSKPLPAIDFETFALQFNTEQQAQ